MLTPESPNTPAAPEPDPRTGIAAVEKAMSTVNLVARAAHPPTFTDLLHASGFPKATLHRLLATLMREGLVRFEAKDRSYRLGLRLLELAHRVWADFDLRVAAADELAAQAEAAGETIELGVLADDHVVVVGSDAPGEAPGTASGVGARRPIHASALGKCIVAYMEPAAQRRLLDGLTLREHAPATLTSVAALRADLDLAHARGYAIEDEERASGMRGIAVPILDHAGQPIGALGLSGPASRLPLPRLHGFASRLIGAARRISHDAGGSSMSLTPAPRPATAPSIDVACVADVHSLLGEGPCWDARAGVLHWVDILKPALHRFDPATGTDVAQPMDAMISGVWPRARGGLLVARHDGLVQLDTDTGRRLPFAHPEAARSSNRYNDGKCDRRGRLWIGSLDMGAAPNRGSLFRVDADGSATRMDSGFTVANGLGFSPDDARLYFTDTGRRTIYVYDFDVARGEIAHRRPFVELSEAQGRPDGLTVDAEGFVWVALWDGWTILRFDPEGRIALRVPVPVPRPTSCCFGGANLATLYITSASVRLPEQALADAPLSGALFACAPGVAGLPETPFAG